MKEFKYNELVKMASIIDIQIVTLGDLIESSNDEENIKFLNSELSPYKTIKNKLKKLIADY